MTEPLSPQYDPKSIETALYREWEERGYFHARADQVLSGEREPYVIVIPPPNVTAVLHMGHGLNNTVQDVLDPLARGCAGRKRSGCRAPTTPGSRRRTSSSASSRRRGRRASTSAARPSSSASGRGSTRRAASILEQLRAIGASCDWARTRFTLDPELSRAVREVFVRLYEKGLIYRGHHIINWCPRCLTSLCDEEAEPEETQGKLYHLRYLSPASTRPGCRARRRRSPGRRDDPARDDARRHGGRRAPGRRALPRRWSARRCELPLTGRRIPIVADEYVDPEFGTGAVKITPAHDPNDFEVGRRHELPALDVMTPEATMNDERARARSAGSTASRRASRSSSGFERAGAAREDRGRTSTPCGTATAATPSSSRGSPISGS